MSNSIVPEHVFISYSHHDKEVADKLISRLRASNVNVWIDHSGLQPGTPNWNKAIRDAIRRSFAVLLLASPNSEQSDVVQGELSLARSYECPIFPIWISGNWEESVPLNMIHAQRIDARNENFNYHSASVMEIVENILKVIKNRAPKHFPIVVHHSYGSRFSKTDLPQGYFCIRVNNQKAVAFRQESYKSLEDLLDDLYLNYLAKRYKPYSYGRDWIITSAQTEVQRLLVPWSWLIENMSDARNHPPLCQSNPSWQLFSLETYRVIENTYWDIIDKLPISAFGVASNNQTVGTYLLNRAAYEERGGKAATYFDQMLDDAVRWHGSNAEYMTVVAADEIKLDDYKFLAVFATRILDNGAAYIPGPLWKNY